jgi:hypothetical protein
VPRAFETLQGRAPTTIARELEILGIVDMTASFADETAIDVTNHWQEFSALDAVGHRTGWLRRSVGVATL